MGKTVVALLVFVAGCMLQAVPGLAAETHPFSVHDMLAMDRISDAQVSPDARTIAFVLRVTDLEANKGRTDIWLVGIDGSGLKRLTTDPAADSNPRWSRDGKQIYFVSSRSGSSQIWRVRVDGGEAQPVTELPLDVDYLVLSPDGSHLAFAMEVFPDCDTPDCTKKRLDERGKSRGSGIIFDRLFVRHWDAWKDGRRSHVFVMPTGGKDAVDIMKGMDADCPSKPFGGTEEFTFAPDGRSVVFAARDAGREEAWSTDFDLYVAPIDASESPVCLTARNEAWDTQPAFSPDGRTLAYLAMRRPRYEADRFRIVLLDWPGGPERVLTEEWDRSPGTIVWSQDSKAIFTTAADHGEEPLFAVDVETGRVSTLVGRGTVRFPALAGERIVYGMDHLKSPVELHSVKSNGKDARALTKINEQKVAAARMGEPEQFSFKGWNDETVFGYVVKPVDFDPKKKYPVAFLIHGGPQGSFGNDFHYRWNPQAYAGAGYAVVTVDFHGSTGYGQKFTDSIRGDWGGKPLEDLQKGLAAALERYTWMDGERVGALGASYGGYMVNWILGNWPDRFKCLVTHDGNIDERFAYYDTEELWFPEWDHQGTPWENPEGYEKQNPVNFVSNWKTPTLVVHGGTDFRVVETQGIGTFSALQRLGIPSKFLYFPDENHWVLKPQNSIQWHDTVVAWLDQWLK
jgi:dipeptidyl aminopeptidase/acylaminoacyl peptidase